LDENVFFGINDIRSIEYCVKNKMGELVVQVITLSIIMVELTATIQCLSLAQREVISV